MTPTEDQIDAMWKLPLEQRRKLPWYEDYLRAEIAKQMAASNPVVNAYVEQQATAEDQYWADVLSDMTDAMIAYRIKQIDIEVHGLPYRALTVSIADRGAGLADERRRLVAERDARKTAPVVDETRRAQFFDAVAKALGVDARESEAA